MADADPSAPHPPEKALASELHGLDPGELLARALNSVKPSAGASPWEPPEPEVLGRLLPGYQIESLLGRGGMGAVYKGVQLNLERPVAIKLLPAEIATDAEFVTRFKREARTLARLQHSRIVTIHDFGQTTEGHLYFVMEYIDGTDLRRLMKGPGLDPEQALAVVGQLCDALQAAHREGIVHRDIKPENVLVTKDGYVKLADFGLSRPPPEDGMTNLTEANVVMGTANYMAPEQQDSAAKADHRSDIFALGVMFYEMLTGQTPRGVFDPPSRKLQIDVRIDEVVLKALQSEPDRRYQQVSEMKTDVDRIRSTPPLAKPPAAPPPTAPPPKPSRSGSTRKRKQDRSPLFAAVVIALFLGATGYFLWLKDARSNSEHRAGAAADPASMMRDSGPVNTTKDAPFVNTLGMKFVPVPIIGGPTGGQPLLFSVWDTRVQDYEAYVKETKREWPKPNFEQGPTNPAVNVNWDDAQLFCQWLTAREQLAGRLPAGFSYRLPSDHEWSCGVELGAREDAAKLPGEKSERIVDAFPWGPQWPPPKGAGNYAGEEMLPIVAAHKYAFVNGVIADYNDGFVNTSPVGSFSANRFGLFDMGGNVWQWCEDWSNKFQTHRVLRGGSWIDDHRAALLSSSRAISLPGARFPARGFRCVLAPANSAPPGAEAAVPAVNGATAAIGAKTAPVVPPDAQRFGNASFMVVRERTTWPDAKKRAEEMGGHLAAITSAEEDQWLAKTFLNGNVYCLWVGAFKDADGRWKWTTGAPFQFTNWERRNGVAEPDPKENRTRVYFRKALAQADGQTRAFWANRAEDGEDVSHPWFLVEWEDSAAAPGSASSAAQKVPGPSTQPKTAADRVQTASAGLPTPSPSTDKEALEKALISHVWTWKPVGSESFRWTEVVFGKDGTMTTSTATSARWDITGPRSVDLFFNNGDHLNLTFHFGFDYFTGSTGWGKEVVNGWAKPLLEASTPAPASIPASDKAALEKALLSHAWTWVPIAPQSYPWNEIVFWRDGTMTTSTPTNAQWTITGPRSVALDFGVNNRITLTFYGGLDYYTGCRADGKTMVSGKINASSAVSTLSPASTTAATAAAEQALVGSKWSIGRGKFQFLADHVIHYDGGQLPLRTWHWWATGPRRVHIQSEAEPAFFDASKGADLLFDAAFASYVGGKNGEIKGTRASLQALPAAVPAAPAIPKPIETSAMKQIVDVQFARSSTGFFIGGDEKRKTTWAGGEYRFFCTLPGVLWPNSSLLEGLHLTDFVCEVRARAVQAVDGGWGLGLIGAKGGADHPWTGIMLNAAGKVSSRSYDNGPELPWLSVPAVHLGGEANTLRVEASGTRMRIFVNGQFVVDRDHERLKPDSALAIFCFGGSPPEDIHFQSVQVWVPR